MKKIVLGLILIISTNLFGLTINDIKDKDLSYILDTSTDTCVKTVPSQYFVKYSDIRYMFRDKKINTINKEKYDFLIVGNGYMFFSSYDSCMKIVMSKR